MNDRPESSATGQTSRLEIELSQLDLRYEGHRLRQRSQEDRLLASIAREGIREPLAGVVVQWWSRAYGWCLTGSNATGAPANCM